MQRSVSCSLTAQVLERATVELQVAVAGQPPLVEDLLVTLDGRPAPVRELATEAGGRIHLLDAEPGTLQVTYRATVQGTAVTPAVQPLDSAVYVRPSRYAESDRLAAFAQAELGRTQATGDVLRAAAAWVGSRLSYVPGSSTGTDGAVDTLLRGEGVCRDYAHLTVALLRALDVPARVVAVYAPGASPMDFHAVAEAIVDGVWCAVDPTLLAPRSSMLRIATGRDAADTAFLSSYGGGVQLDAVSVQAVVDGELPGDDLGLLVSLA